MPYITIMQFLEKALNKNCETLKDLEALTIEGSLLDEIKLLNLPGEIQEILNKQYYGEDLGVVPSFVIWTIKRIYFVSSENRGPEYEGGYDEFDYRIISLPRNPMAELIQRE
jgi:hypothetical protein